MFTDRFIFICLHFVRFSTFDLLYLSNITYFSLNRISPSKLSVCNSKDSNGVNSLEQIPAGSDSSGCQKDEIRSVSSDEFLAMERSAAIDEPLPPVEKHASYKDHNSHHGVSGK